MSQFLIPELLKRRFPLPKKLEAQEKKQHQNGKKKCLRDFPEHGKLLPNFPLEFFLLIVLLEPVKNVNGLGHFLDPELFSYEIQNWYNKIYSGITPSKLLAP